MTMRVTVIEMPTPGVTWEEAEAHLRLGGDTSEQALVESFIAAAQAHLDGPNGCLGRSVGLQTLEVRLDGFAAGPICLPYPPAIEIESVKYGPAGTEQTLAPSEYELVGFDLLPTAGRRWPTGGPVRIRYQAGYEELPPPLRAAILLMVGDLFRYRETVTPSANATAVPMSTTVQALIAPFRGVFA